MVVYRSYASRLRARRAEEMMKELTLRLKKARLDGDADLIRDLTRRRDAVDRDLRAARSEARGGPLAS